tara:strand:- start:478 stop:1608 length:1131 start_codon:yes stop_codon:yes gene_type:complete
MRCFTLAGVMPIIDSEDNGFSKALSRKLVQRFNWTSGFFLDTEYSNEPAWLVSSSAFKHWFELLQENLQLNLGRRLAHAAADSEELRLKFLERPRGFFNKNKNSLSLINEDWSIRGLGTIKIPSKAFKLKKLELEVHGRLQSSFSSGLANAAWEWLVKKRHRFRWEDSGRDIALVHLEEDNLEIAEPKNIVTKWPYRSCEFHEIQKNPLLKPFELDYGGWELLGERHMFLYQDFILRLIENITTYASESPEVNLNVDWGVFKINSTEKNVWSGIAKSSSDLFRAGGELFMVAEPESWVGASQAELVEHGLGGVVKSRGVDSHGGVELEFSNLFHPAIVTGILLGCWSRSEGRDAKASWRYENETFILEISSKSEIA